MIKKIFTFILGLILLPAYPLLKKAQRELSEKMKIGEKVVVVIENNHKKRAFTN